MSGFLFGWTLSERAGHVTADRNHVITHGGEADASLVIDDTQAQKKDTKSVGVAFQHCGLTCDVRSCQTMVMLTKPEMARPVTTATIVVGGWRGWWRRRSRRRS
ncbi:transposase [Streptomyces sp. NPDC016675]|uniref:transposase n=1 Tax=Streptomyces sp. NPDC016675 TaxID=3364970 RepID=UPI003703477B